jgi:hypothetical protein
MLICPMKAVPYLPEDSELDVTERFRKVVWGL